MHSFTQIAVMLLSIALFLRLEDIGSVTLAVVLSIAAFILAFLDGRVAFPVRRA